MMDLEKSILDPNQEVKKVKQYIATTCVSLGAVCAGTVLAWTSPVLPQLRQTHTNSSTETWSLTESQSGMVGSMLAFGALLSALPAGYMADKFGRKKSLLFLAFPFLLNWLLIIFANGPYMLYAARFFGGLATGAMCVCAPMYIGEIAHASIRGALGSFFQMFICTGILLTYFFGALFVWRTLSVILALCPVIFACCFFLMPETPVYLIKIGDIDAAKKSMTFFRGENYNVLGELSEIQEDVDQANAKKSGVKDLIATKGNRKALISGIGIMFFQQFSGINAVIFYTVPIFKSAGSSLSPDLAAIIVGVVQLIFAYVSVMVIERANRRFYLKLSSIGMGICLTALGLYYHLKSHQIDFTGLGILPLASLVLFIMAFSMGLGPVPWMIMSELFAPEIKGTASGLAVMTNWICVFIVTFSFPLMNTYLGGHVTFYFFAMIMVLGTLFVHFVLPETRGKTLQDIQAILNK